MEFLGVGPLELLFIFLIALIVLGPRDMVKTGRTLGKFLNKVVRSPTWQAIKQTSREMRYLPNRLMREAGMEEEFKELSEINRDVQELRKIPTPFNLEEVEKDTPKVDNKESSRDLSAWTTTPPDQPSIEQEYSILPSTELPVQEATTDFKNNDPITTSDSQTPKASSFESDSS